MKKITLLIVLISMILAPVAFAASESISFGWDANTETDLAGYRLYMSSTPGAYTLVGKNPSLNPTNPPANYVQSVAKPAITMTANVSGTDGQNIYFVLTAFDSAGNESKVSNEVTYTLSNAPPAAPKGFWAKLLQIISNIIMHWKFHA